MSKQGEGGGVFKVAIRDELRATFDAAPKAIQAEIKSMLMRAAIDPTVTRVIFAEGQQIVSGLVRDGDKFYYVRLRFTYEPERHFIILAEMSKPMLVPGMN